MKAILLVAIREFRQVTSTRGFWIMLLTLPLVLAISATVSSKFAPNRAIAYSIVDASGRFEPQLKQRLEMTYQQNVLRGLSNYVERWKLADVDPAAPWARRGSWLVESEVARFVAAGGADGAIARFKDRLPKDAPQFKPAERYVIQVPVPAAVPVNKGAEAFGKAIAQSLRGDVQTKDGKRPYGLALYIPANYGAPGAVAQVWTNGPGQDGLLTQIRDDLTAQLKRGLLQSNGLTPDMIAMSEQMRAPIAMSEPPLGEGRSIISTKSIIPLMLVYLLLVTSVSTGSMMLQGLVEERSNKLIESVLACIKPEALMYGKLLGLGAVGLCVITAWIGCAVGAAFAFPGVAADMLRPSLAAFNDPWIIAATAFYFLSGYVILSMIFLAIGSLSDSMQDAQAYLTPVLMLVMMPVIFLIQATLRSPDELFVQIMSWIPLYTPFAMLARLGAGVSAVEIAGTTLVVIAFVALELIFLGRLFSASLLSAGKPGWGALFRKLVSKEAAN